MSKAITKEKKNTPLPKGVGIAIGIVIDLIFIAVILFHHNPIAVQKEELISVRKNHFRLK